MLDLSPKPTWTGPRPTSVECLVRPYMVKKALENTRRFNYFHPSAWGQCIRKIAYQYYNDKTPFLQRSAQDIDDKMERIFDNGHSMHARWQNYLDHAGYLRGYWQCSKCRTVYGKGDKLGILNPSREKNWKCSCGSTERLSYKEIHISSDPKYKFEGNCDGVIDVRGTDMAQGRFDVFVIDFKSAKDETFCEITQPKQEHVVQVNIYMWGLELDAAVVMYENKDQQKLKEFFVPRDEKLIEKIKEESLWLQEVLSVNKLPNRPNGFSRSKIPCLKCEFKKFCY